MNKFRTFLKLAFFTFMMFVLDFIMPLEFAFYIVWVIAGLIGISRLFPATLQFDGETDWIDVLLIIVGSVFGFATFCFAEYLGDLDAEDAKTLPATQEKITQ